MCYPGGMNRAEIEQRSHEDVGWMQIHHRWEMMTAPMNQMPPT
jgi:hypothetical protein